MNEPIPSVTCARCGAVLATDDSRPCPRCGWSGESEASGVPVTLDQKQVMLRDLVIFQVKLFLDGVKDLILVPLSIGAFLFDILPRSGKRAGRNFYAVMRAGEKFDLWLNLYDASRQVDARTDGLFGESMAGANNLIGKVEEAVRQTVEVGKETVEHVRSRKAEPPPQPGPNDPDRP